MFHTVSNQAAKDRTPWHCGIVFKGLGDPHTYALGRLHGCGVLVGPRWVLTAWHTVRDLWPGQILIYAGSRCLPGLARPCPAGERGKFLDVQRCHAHPQARDLTATLQEHDLALLELASPAPLPAIVCGSLEEVSELKALGWGASASQWLREVPLRPLEPRIDPAPQPVNTICAVGPHGEDTEALDSGGPLVGRVGDGWKLVGITSAGSRPGAQTRYGVYCLLHPYREWIERITELRLSEWKDQSPNE